MYSYPPVNYSNPIAPFYITRVIGFYTTIKRYNLHGALLYFTYFYSLFFVIIYSIIIGLYNYKYKCICIYYIYSRPNYTQTLRCAQAQNSVNTRELCTTVWRSNNGKDFMFSYVARVSTKTCFLCISYQPEHVASTYHIELTIQSLGFW